jgi:hypothetical protein
VIKPCYAFSSIPTIHKVVNISANFRKIQNGSNRILRD